MMHCFGYSYNRLHFLRFRWCSCYRIEGLHGDRWQRGELQIKKQQHSQTTHEARLYLFLVSLEYITKGMIIFILCLRTPMHHSNSNIGMKHPQETLLNEITPHTPARPLCRNWTTIHDKMTERHQIPKPKWRRMQCRCCGPFTTAYRSPID